MRNHHALDNVALDVETENLARGFLGFGWVVHNLDTAGLATATDLNLSLDDNGSADLGCGCFGLFWGVCNQTL